MKCFRNKTVGVMAALVWLIGTQWAGAAAGVSLEAGFRSPPGEAGIRCYWWWLNGNVTKEAITRDLEAMRAKGFGGALLFDAGGASQRGNKEVPAGPLFGSRDWRALFRHAVAEAARLGLELSLSIQSGWNLGGPSVTGERAAKMLTWSRRRVRGPVEGPITLERPKQRGGYYRDIAVLAYPAPEGEGEGDIAYEFKASSAQRGHPAAMAFDGEEGTFWVSGGIRPGEGPTKKRPEWIELRFARPVKAAGFELAGRTHYGPRAGELQVEIEGKGWAKVVDFKLADGERDQVRFAAREGTVFRLVIWGAYDGRFPEACRNVQVCEFGLRDEGGRRLGGKKGNRPIRDLEAKAVFRELGGSAPDCRFLLTDEPGEAGEAVVRREEMVNLTEQLGPEGKLDWKAPTGDWEILRFGYTLNGGHVSTSSGAWQGPVLDYMSREAVRWYWRAEVAPLLAEVEPEVGKALRYVHTDSWECGGANWTADFPAAFQRRRGYDPVGYLPILAGAIVESREVSNRFLADFRKTIGDCVAEEHYAELAALAHGRGLGIHPESGGPHAGPFDALKCLGRNDIPMGEFWVPSPHRPRPEHRFFVKQPASAAHVYGRRVVGAEAFTSIGPHWDDALWRSQKPSFDHEVCAGLNLAFVHTFTCSPEEMGRPGQEYFAGTHFNPQVTWWDLGEGFTTYLNRCQFMLQQGRFVADVLYYYGDHVPNLVQRKAADPGGALPGYDYDVINEEALSERAGVREGQIELTGGMCYRVLALPEHRVLSLKVLRKVRELVEGGATVVGSKPERTVSLEGYPESEGEFRAIVDQLWGRAEAGERKTGRGRMVWGKKAREVLQKAGVAADFELRGRDYSGDFDYIHVTIEGADVYFVSNQTEGEQRVVGRFRVRGRQPEIWEPVTGRMQEAQAFRQAAGRTEVPLTLGPYGSVFVVFRRGIGADVEGKGERNFPDYQAVQEIEGPWEVRFDPAWGGPERVTFERLMSWTEREEDGIRYYSGKATYYGQFEWAGEKKTGPEYVLDLGEVGDVGIARVRLNGEDLGVVWTKPFRVAVTEALKAGENRVEIEVVNSWRNRLVGDRGLPEGKRYTRTNVRIRSEWGLLKSGLLGPVRLWREVK